MRNRWNIWVYPAVKKTVDNLPYVTTRLDRTAQDKLNKGESVLLLTYGTVPPEKGGDIAVGFSSIFWNTAWTRGQAPHTLGVCCDAKHPALAAFPNDLQNDLNKRPAAAQFRQSLLEYMASESFNPLQELKIEDVLYTK